MLKNMEKKRISILLVIIIIIVLMLSIGNKEKKVPITDHDIVFNQTKKKTPTKGNQTRSFYLGLTPFPYDITNEAVDQTYRFLSEHTDLIAHHFDSGVPWPEAYHLQEYHKQVQENINTRIQHY